MKTELCAVAPADWDVKSIEEVCIRVTSGGTPSRREPSYYVDGIWPWVKTQELQDKWLDDTEEHITAEAVSASSAKVLPENTVLVAMYGATVGQLGLLRRPMTCNQACSALVVDPGAADFRFVFYQLLQARTQLKSLATGAAQQNLSGVLIKSLRFPYPPVSEQRAIAHILGTLDDKIELNRRENETLEALARAVFKSWFVDFDPVRAKAEGRDPGLPKPLADLFPDSFENSELRAIPQGWEVRGLDEIARFLNGLALQKYPPRDGESLPVIKIAQLRAGHTSHADRASADLPSDYVVEDGDVLFSWSGSLECILWAGGRGALNQHLFRVTSREFPKWFFYLWIGQHLAGFRRIAAAKATTMGHIQRHHLSEAKVVVPSRELLIAADRYLRPLIDAIPKLLVQCRTLGVLRDELLPKLVSGEVQIENAAAFIGERE
jgi:type I restriction enzyme, S subunit